MLKQYNSIKEMARDMRTIKRITRPLAANIKETTAAIDEKDVIKIRGKGAPDYSKPTAPLNTKSTQAISKKSDDLDKLMDHQRQVSSILNTLQNEFRNEDYDEKNKMITVAKRLLDSIALKIKTVQSSIATDAKSTLPKLLGQVANILKTNLDKKLLNICDSASSKILVGSVNGDIQHTIYYMYHNVQDDSGEITPLIVFGLSYKSNNIYINPSLHDIVVPGKFNTGRVLKAGGPTDMARSALKEINTQLAADSILSGVAGSAVPFNKKKLDTLKPNNIKVSFVSKDDALTVLIKQKIGQVAVQELANNLTTQLNTMILSDKSLPKLSIRYTKKKLISGWELTYKFIPSGRYTGKTLDEEDVSHLRKRFSDEEIHKMLIAIQN